MDEAQVGDLANLMLETNKSLYRQILRLPKTHYLLIFFGFNDLY